MNYQFTPYISLENCLNDQSIETTFQIKLLQILLSGLFSDGSNKFIVILLINYS